MAERRAAPRHALVLSADITVVDSGARASARTADICQNGCYIDTLNPLPPGTYLQLRVTRGSEAFETHARVVYQAPGLGMGVAFFNVHPAQQCILDRWLVGAPVA